MKEEKKTREQLVSELEEMRQRIAELEGPETERKQAEEELVDEATRRRILIDQSRDGIVILDQGGKVYESNQRFAEMLGYSIEEVLQLHVFDWEFQFPPEQVLDMIQTVDETGDHFETKHRRKDGTIYDVEISTNAAVFAGQKLIFCVCRDITEHKQVEEELIRNRDYLERLNNSLTDMVFEIKFPERTIRYINKAVEAVLGYSREECMGQSIEMIYPSTEIFREVGRRLRKGMERGDEVTTSEHELKRKDGRIITVEGRTSYFREDGEMVSAFSVVRNITEHKQAEEELRQSEERYKAIFELGSDVGEAIIINQDMPGQIAAQPIFNDEWIRITGYSWDELLHMSYFDLIHPAQRDTAINRYHRRLQGEKIRDPLELTVVRKDGTEISIEALGTLTSFRGQNATIVYARDITERKHLEEDRQKAAKLESIGTLAGGIAHDFNNILTGIMGNIGLAMRHVEPKSKAEERLLEAEKASIRARDLTQQLLTFSRGGAPIKKTVSIIGLLKESVGFALRGSNISCDFDLPEDLWPVEVDEGQINQVITNVVINAQEAMPEGGVINITAGNTVVPDKATLPIIKGRYVNIAIVDQGVGIKKEHLARILEPYFTTKQKGSGLGLATSYSIVKAHGGYITVDSTPAVGTAFQIYLPASKELVAAIEETKAESVTTGEGRILVMDDEEMVRDLLYAELTEVGYEVVRTKDGTEAIECYTKAKESGQPFDAVIMDLTIPGGMGGKVAIKKLLEIDPDAKVIVSSGYATDPIMSEYKKYGFSAVVTKPYRVDEIEKTLQSLLKKK